MWRSITSMKLEDAFPQRARAKQKIQKLRDEILELENPSMEQLMKLRQYLWELYDDYSKAHSCIVGNVPDGELAQQEEEYNDFDQLFNEAGVPLEEKLIALRRAAPKASVTYHVAHQQHPWSRSVPNFYGCSKRSTRMMACETVQLELSGKTDKLYLRSRLENLEAEMVLRNYSPPTSSSSSPPEPRSRCQTLEADTALQSCMPPSNGPSCRSKPTSVRDALETDVIMRNHLPPTDANPKGLPVPSAQNELRGRVLQNDGSRKSVTQNLDSHDNLETSDVSAENGTETNDSKTQLEIEMMLTVPLRPNKFEQFDFQRAVTDGDARTKVTESLSAVNLQIKLDQKTSRRDKHANFPTSRADPNPYLPAAAKAPDKNCQTNARPNHQRSESPEFQNKQNLDPANEVSPQEAPNETPASLTFGDLRDKKAFNNCPANKPFKHKDSKPTQKQLCTRRSKKTQPTDKSNRSERKASFKCIHDQSQNPAPKKNIRTREVLGHWTHLIGSSGQPLRRRANATVRKNCTTVDRTKPSHCCSELPATVVESRRKSKIPQKKILLQPTNATATATDSTGHLLRSPKNQPQEWIPNNPPHTLSAARMPRSENRFYDDGLSYARECRPRIPTTQDVGLRKPTNDSEPTHRKCNVGKRKLIRENRPSVHNDNHAKLYHRNCLSWNEQSCTVSSSPSTRTVTVVQYLINNSTLRSELVNVILISKSVEPMLQRGEYVPYGRYSACTRAILKGET